MSKKQRNEKIIRNREEYIKYFTDNNQKSNDKVYSKQQEALKYALDTRKFEIELYWKRATYFWAFIALSFTGYFAQVNNANKQPLLIVSILGFIFSYSWHFVNRGSKFWQNNWERHVDYLQNEIMGPLYTMVIDTKNRNFFNPVKEYPFSASKVNQLLSLIISAIWIYLIYDTLAQAFSLMVVWQRILVVLIFVVVITFIFVRFGSSSFSHRQTVKENIKFVIRDIE